MSKRRAARLLDEPGVCGKKEDTALRQDALTDASSARATAEHHAGRTGARAVMRGCSHYHQRELRYDAVQRQVDIVCAEAKRLAAGGAVAEEYDMKRLWTENEDIRSLKSLILFGIRGMAAYAYHAMVLGYMDDEVNAFFYTALRAIGSDMGMGELLPLVLETGRVNLACMALLDRANTEAYGDPTPVTVPLTVEKGPFIVISGHT